jgi:hypothetical protein
VLETLGALAGKRRERAGGEVTRPGTRPDPATLRYPVNPETWSRPNGSGNTYSDADQHLQGERHDHTRPPAGEIS